MSEAPSTSTPSSLDRRAFVAHGVVGLGAAAVAASPLGSTAIGAARDRFPDGDPAVPPAFDPWSKLRAISPRAKQLWPVIYTDAARPEATAERDVAAALAGGADAVVLELGDDVGPLERALKAVRARFPGAKVGANFLGSDADPYGFHATFRLARELDLAIAWTDFSGVDRIRERDEISLHDVEAERAPGAFYVSGVHMKYGTLLDPSKSIEQSALQAMGWVEGLVITGPRTGMPADPELAKRARRVIGAYPMGAASGVSAQNFASIRDAVDFCLVNTSISDADHRILTDKVRELRRAMDAGA
jgi:hypothetical protein